MTYSLLAFDADSGTWGGIAATGNLCVGGWVLRGRAGAGVSASQGHTPSTLWGETVLDLQAGGASAQQAIAQVTGDDEGRSYRQLSSLDRQGSGAAFTGTDNLSFCGHLIADGAVAAGNILSGARVLEAMIEAFTRAEGMFPQRLLAGLAAGEAAGGDDRGTLSAALLQVGVDMAPLDLRVDHSRTAIADLRALYARTLDTEYAAWARSVPTMSAPVRAPENEAEHETPRAVSART